MIHNITRNAAYNYSITYEKPQSKVTIVLTRRDALELFPAGYQRKRV